MRRYQKALQKTKELPRTPSKKPKREKLIRVTNETYEALMDMGKMGDDFEDVISRLIKEHKERHG